MKVILLVVSCGSSVITGYTNNLHPFHCRASASKSHVGSSRCASMTSRCSSSPPSSWTHPRRSVLLGASSGMFGGIFRGGNGNNAASSAPLSSYKSSGPTNEVLTSVRGMKRKRLGGSDVIVSELGLGTQRWCSTDYNAPQSMECMELMDEAILNHGVNLIDTAEQYPIPSGNGESAEGATELVIGRWMKERKVGRDEVVIASKITGGRNVTPKNIREDCEGSLKRLGTDYLDVYQLHWPARYSPQSNWGQSLKYNVETERSPYWRGQGGPTSFEDLCVAMEDLIQKGKIRGWGLCNDNAYGLTGCTRTAKALGVTPPCSIQGDFSLIDRKSEENGVAEAASPYNENVGFMSYNALAGGMLTGKYIDQPAALDSASREDAMKKLNNPRGRMDTRGWGGTLYRYRTESAQSAILDYNQIVKSNPKELTTGSLTELSLRWNRQRSLVTTTLVGHSNVSQLKESLACFENKNPLSDQIMWEVDRIHMRNRTPIFSSNRVGKDWDGEGEIGEPIP
eukprot:CAMPEP_0195513780 /NCGR_PEP_ID=MMETSP0794_2-20130614/5353_1 /TAXON_ID=515487 /ORGANISM="Stephanopyxis turris, Strain CCMP 815" /LENGTH=510 /DNA_ID=CAMNT_0040641879 /DNA_START=140 /DNA_END=1672 /DNA_ORIENTATION=-